MFSNLLNKIKEILRRMVAYKTVEEVIEDDIYSTSEEMTNSIDTWRKIYKDESPWLDEKITSLGLGKAICQIMQMQVMSEMESRITNNEYLDGQYQNHFIQKLFETALKDIQLMSQPVYYGEVYHNMAQLFACAYNDKQFSIR